jgi:hypothetical protein
VTASRHRRDGCGGGVSRVSPDTSFGEPAIPIPNHDRLRFSWERRANGGAVVVDGTDFVVIAADRRLQTVTGFRDHVPTIG